MCRLPFVVEFAHVASYPEPPGEASSTRPPDPRVATLSGAVRSSRAAGAAAKAQGRISSGRYFRFENAG